MHSELAREKMWARIHLVPVLQAEEDRDMVRRYWADRAREKELLGAETSPYNTDRYVSFFFVWEGVDVWRCRGGVRAEALCLLGSLGLGRR